MSEGSTPSSLAAEKKTHRPWLGCILARPSQAGSLQDTGRDWRTVSPSNEEASDGLLVKVFGNAESHKVAGSCGNALRFSGLLQSGDLEVLLVDPTSELLDCFLQHGELVIGSLIYWREGDSAFRQYGRRRALCWAFGSTILLWRQAGLGGTPPPQQGRSYMKCCRNHYALGLRSVLRSLCCDLWFRM